MERQVSKKYGSATFVAFVAILAFYQAMAIHFGWPYVERLKAFTSSNEELFYSVIFIVGIHTAITYAVAASTTGKEALWYRICSPLAWAMCIGLVDMFLTTGATWGPQGLLVRVLLWAGFLFFFNWWRGVDFALKGAAKEDATE